MGIKVYIPAVLLVLSSVALSQTKQAALTASGLTASGLTASGMSSSLHKDRTFAAGGSSPGTAANTESVGALSKPNEHVSINPWTGHSPAESLTKLSGVYRLGTGDSVDIRIPGGVRAESTHYEVGPGGFLDYPLAGEPIRISGLTAEEAQERISTKIKLYDRPQVVVKVTQYSSHNVFVTGLVNMPGPVILRREAVPLYVILAESQPLENASNAIVMRPSGESISIPLADIGATGALVLPGDVIVISAAPKKVQQYFYVGGKVVSPGQKVFRDGVTLTQAIVDAGGVLLGCDGTARIFRQGQDGRLAQIERKLWKIRSGEPSDPDLQPGDRIEIGTGAW